MAVCLKSFPFPDNKQEEPDSDFPDLSKVPSVYLDLMQKYIFETLAAGRIHPSSSPAQTGFLFVSKMGGGLRPCIDYRDLNQITIKSCYPLPLISLAFQLLQELLSSPSWIFKTLTTWLEYEKEMNGKWMEYPCWPL